MIPCKFQYDSPSRIAAGFHRYVCQRCGRDCHSPYEAGRQTGPCSAWPTAGEPGYWLVLILAAAGITQRRYVWCKQRFGLSPICTCPDRAEAMNTIWQDTGSRYGSLPLALPAVR